MFSVPSGALPLPRYTTPVMFDAIFFSATLYDSFSFSALLNLKGVVVYRLPADLGGVMVRSLAPLYASVTGTPTGAASVPLSPGAFVPGLALPSLERESVEAARGAADGLVDVLTL